MSITRRFVAVAFLSVAALALSLAAPAVAVTSQGSAQHVTAVSTVKTAAKNAGWKWSKAYKVPALRDAVNAIECPTKSLCLAISANKVYWTKSAAGGKSTWKHATVEPATQPYVVGGIILDDVSCASKSFCVIVDNIGNRFVSTNPTGGAKAWHGLEVASTELRSISCPSTHLCAAIDSGGTLHTTAHPGGTAAWSAVYVGGGFNQSFYGISCASTSLCVAVEANSRIYYSTNPAAATPTWKSKKVGSGDWDDVACPTTKRCVAAGGFDSGHGRIASSGSPRTGAWKSKALGTTLGYAAISCASAKLCLALGFPYDRVATSPTATASHWKKTKTPTRGSQTAVACPTTKRCYVGTATNQFIVGKR